jgi:hypothetical protein
MNCNCVMSVIGLCVSNVEFESLIHLISQLEYLPHLIVWIGLFLSKKIHANKP